MLDQIRIQCELLKSNFPLLPEMSRRGGGEVLLFTNTIIFARLVDVQVQSGVPITQCGTYTTY
jgi:hypothetical protein